MMLGEGHRPAPAIHVPPWPAYEDVVVGGASYSVLPVSGVASGNGAGGGGEYSPYLLGEAALAALQRFLPSNEVYGAADGGEYSPYLLGEAALAALQRFLPSNEIYGAADGDGAGEDSAVDAFSCDEFRIYEFKVRRCARGRSHDWTECPYAHPGEKARRRDPRKYHYSGIACPEFRKGCCKKGDSCEYAHGVFECWLHPARYRTQPCKDGVSCRRRVCFFAHTPEQLRVLPTTQCPPSPRGGVDDGSSPLRHTPSSLDAYFAKNNLISSPTSTLISPPMSPPSDSPPLSPNGPSIRRFSLPVGSSSMNEVLASFRQLQLSKAKSVPASWGIQVVAGLGSPRGVGVRPGFCSSLPATPTRTPMGGCGGLFEDWGEPTERVESGRDLRAKIYEKLSKEIGMGRGEEEEEDDGGLRGGAAAPDVGWVSDLLK